MAGPRRLELLRTVLETVMLPTTSETLAPSPGLEPEHPFGLLPPFQGGALPNLGLRQLAMLFGLEPKRPLGLLAVFETAALPN